jgi:hypothetical protein
MRRILLTAVTTTALALPGVALAHAGEHEQGEHQQRVDRHGAQLGERHHARHHRHARLLAFHAQAPAGTAPSTAEGSAPVPTPVAAERAGTIASFTDGTLTITLNDGASVSGKVTPRTEIECRSTLASAADHGDGGRGEENGGGSGEGSGSGPGEEGSSGPSGRDGRDDNDVGDNDAGDEAEQCMPAALVPGASVREAVLSVSSAGAFWMKLEL